jgi:hypothetical protein
MQTLNQLQASGAPIEQARVHLMGDFSAQTGYDASKEVTAAVGEYMAVEGSRPELLKRHAVLGELKREFGVGVADSGPMKGTEMAPPDSGEIAAAQKYVFASLEGKHPFAKAFRNTKRAEGQVGEPTSYGDFMKRATGRDMRPKPKKPFSFSSAVAPSTALPSVPSISALPQSHMAYGADSDSAPAPTSAPVSSTAYSARSGSEPASVYGTDTDEDANALPEGYVSQEEAEAQL